MFTDFLLFTDVVLAQVKADIDSLFARIESQRENISQLLSEESKHTSAALGARPASRCAPPTTMPDIIASFLILFIDSFLFESSRQAPYTAGGFDNTVGSIQIKYGELARLLPALTAEIEPRRAAMEETLGTVKTQVQPMLAELQARRLKQQQQLGGGGGNSSSGAGRMVAPGAHSSAAKKGASVAPAAALQKHLGRK